MSKELSEFLSKELEKHNISARELSRRAGLSIMAVNYILKNPDSTPTVDTCRGLAEALNLPLAAITQLAGYGELIFSTEVDPEIEALAIYLNSLSEETRAYALDACWSMSRLFAQARGEKGNKI